jgi:hypothetical protein
MEPAAPLSLTTDLDWPSPERVEPSIAGSIEWIDAMLGFRTNARERSGDGCCADASPYALASLVITDLVMPASIAHANTHAHTQ